ncbi:hypothetical protein TL16_g07015 [Triparma laevis f. inornata]|uniref:RRM domain-containing protein n=1 Tax=Triparma laevis f. inornata TaxID=1714386 RepID=A0A9W7ARM0_9STRA|nr:hypothetical protein TL16_g07015 [Triparma laevis f. inornata]
MPPRKNTKTGGNKNAGKQKDDGPPYDYVKSLQTYFSCRSNAFPSTAPQIPSIAISSGSDKIDPVDKALLCSGLEALGQMTRCKPDCEGGGVLPPLVSILATVDQQAISPPETPDDSFAQSTLKVYPGSLFLHTEAALALELPSPEDKSSIASSLQLIQEGVGDCAPIDRLSCLARAYVTTFKGLNLNISSPLPPLWLAYADSSASEGTLSARWESVTAVQNLNRSLRLALIETHKTLQDDLLKSKISQVYAHVAASMLPIPDYTNYHFGTYFSSVKSRVHGLKKELEEEAFDSEAVKPLIATADNILSTSPAPLDDLTIQFHKSLHATCEQLQSKLSDIGMSAYYSVSDVPPLESVLAGGFQSGCGSPTLLPTLSWSANSRKNAEKKSDSNSKALSFVPLYERYISEAPTVGEVWADYVRCLVEAELSAGDGFCLSLARDVVNRAIKNVPWSLELHKLRAALVASVKPEKVTDELRERVLKQVRKAVDKSCKNKFLGYPGKMAVWVGGAAEVRRLLITLKGGNTPPTNPKQSEDDMDENDDDDDDEEDGDEKEDLIDDLISDLREFYDAADEWSNKNKRGKKFKEARVLRSRAVTEALVICDDEKETNPVEPVEGGEDGAEGEELSEAERCWEKLVNVDASNYDSWEQYINYMLNKKKVAGFNAVAQLYRKAFNGILGREGDFKRDIESAKRMGQKFVAFEEDFHDLVWALRAKHLVNSKLQKAIELKEAEDAAKTPKVVAAPVVVKAAAKPIEKGKETESPQKRKRDKDENEAEAATAKKAKSGKFVMVGDLKWPAHPTTVHVSNLHLNAEDLDVAELFRKCGDLIHVRVLREKEFVNNKKVATKSKGRALVQFLREESVEEALKFDDAVGILDKIIRVERSRMAAVEPVAGAVKGKKGGKGKGGGDRGGAKGKGGGERGGEEGGGAKPAAAAAAVPKKPTTMFKPRSTQQKQKPKPPKLGKGGGASGPPKSNSDFLNMLG